MSDLMPLKQWNAVGRKVLKGAKAFKFNEEGVALFHKNQTVATYSSDYYDGPALLPGVDCGYNYGGECLDQMDFDLGLCGQI